MLRRYMYVIRLLEAMIGVKMQLRNKSDIIL